MKQKYPRYISTATLDRKSVKKFNRYFEEGVSPTSQSRKAARLEEQRSGGQE